MLVAIGMAVFFAMFGLVLDGGAAYLEQRNLQRAADVGATGGAWAFYHSNYQESDSYPVSVSAGLAAAHATVSSTLAANGYGSLTPTVTFTDAAGNDLDTSGCGSGGPCPQAWEVRGVHVKLSRVLPTQVSQAVGAGNPTIAAEARAVLGPNTGAAREVPLLVRNDTLPRVSGAACAPAPGDGARYPMSPDCRPSTGQPWTSGQPLTLEPGWNTASPALTFPFNQVYSPVVTFDLLHEPPDQEAPSNTARQATVAQGLAEFLRTCPVNCASQPTLYADMSLALSSDPVPAGMQTRINAAGAGTWASQQCSAPRDPAHPLTPDNPRLVRLPVTYAAAGTPTVDPNVGGFKVSETLMFCADSVAIDGATGSYGVEGYLVEEPSSQPTVLSPDDSYFGRDVVVRLVQ